MDHRFKKGDVVNIFQMSTSEGLLFEGRATVVAPATDVGEDYYYINFHNANDRPEKHRYLRFAVCEGTVDPATYIAEFNQKYGIGRKP